MSNAWDHLPNAKHIDKVLVHAKTYPEKWDAAWVATRRDAVRDAVRGAIVVLIAYDDCAHMLEFTPEQIHLYACLGIPAAILLEPAVTAMYNVHGI